MVASIYRQELHNISNGNPSGIRHSLDDRKPMINGVDLSLFKSAQPRRMGGILGEGNSEGFSKEMVSRIYRDELNKLSNAAQKSGNFAEHNMYQQELQRIANNARESCEKKRSAEDMSPTPVKKIKTEPVDDINTCTSSGIDHSVMSLVKHKTERDTDTPLSSHHSGKLSPLSSYVPSQDPGDIRHNGSAFYLVHPRPPSNCPPRPSSGPPTRPSSSTPSLHGGTPQPFDSHGAAAVAASAMGFQTPLLGSNSGSHSDGVSPLQRMQSIANSLMTANNTNKPGTPLGFNSSQLGTGKPLRAVLPPISQEQFDGYSNMNTDDLVHRVKETLSQYSISQRLFGEHILGLSQGSVSDLLARPKTMAYVDTKRKGTIY